jgi:hypothetical protein
MFEDSVSDATATRQLTNEDRLIVAEAATAAAEYLLSTRNEHDCTAAAAVGERLCIALGIEVTPQPKSFNPSPDRVVLAHGYAVRLRQALAGRRTRDLPRFVEGLCQNLGLEVDSADAGVYVRAVMEHIELNVAD